MPKENTHLWFARSLTASSGTAVELRSLRKEPLFFFLGSVIPDAFFYDHRPRVRRLARVLHGSDPDWSGRTPLHLARLAGRTDSHRDKAFVLGYLAHLALDVVFHPVVHVLSGKRKGRISTSKTVARHRLVETALDRIVNSTCFYHLMMHPRLGDRVAPLQTLATDLGLRAKDVRRVLTVQHLVNRLVMEHYAHAALRCLDRLPWLDLSALRNLCYAQLDHEPAYAPLAKAAASSGDSTLDKALRAVRRIQWTRLFTQSRINTLNMFQSCADYWRGVLPDHALMESLPRRACD